jgi:hypothetical protein
MWFYGDFMAFAGEAAFLRVALGSFRNMVFSGALWGILGVLI